MSKLLISSDPGLQSAVAGAYARMKADVQAVLDLYTPLGLPALVNSELSLFFNDISTLVFNKMTGGGIATLIFGEGEDAVPLPVNTTQAKNVIQYPSGYPALQEAITQLAAKAYRHDYGIGVGRLITFRVGNITQYFKLDDAGDLQFSNKLQAIISDYGNSYVRTAAGKATAAFLKDVAEAYYANGMDNYVNKIEVGEASQGIPGTILHKYLQSIGTSPETMKIFPELAGMDARLIMHGAPETED